MVLIGLKLQNGCVMDRMCPKTALDPHACRQLAAPTKVARSPSRILSAKCSTHLATTLYSRNSTTGLKYLAIKVSPPTTSSRHISMSTTTTMMLNLYSPHDLLLGLISTSHPHSLCRPHHGLDASRGPASDRCQHTFRGKTRVSIPANQSPNPQHHSRLSTVFDQRDHRPTVLMGAPTVPWSIHRPTCCTDGPPSAGQGAESSGNPDEHQSKVPGHPRARAYAPLCVDDQAIDGNVRSWTVDTIPRQ